MSEAHVIQGVFSSISCKLDTNTWNFQSLAVHLRNDGQFDASLLYDQLTDDLVARKDLYSLDRTIRFRVGFSG